MAPMKPSWGDSHVWILMSHVSLYVLEAGKARPDVAAAVLANAYNTEVLAREDGSLGHSGAETAG